MIRVLLLCGESSLFLFEVAGGFSPIRLTPFRPLVRKAHLIVALIKLFIGSGNVYHVYSCGLGICDLYTFSL